MASFGIGCQIKCGNGVHVHVIMASCLHLLLAQHLARVRACLLAGMRPTACEAGTRTWHPFAFLLNKQFATGAFAVRLTQRRCHRHLVWVRTCLPRRCVSQNAKAGLMFTGSWHPFCVVCHIIRNGVQGIHAHVLLDQRLARVRACLLVGMRPTPCATSACTWHPCACVVQLTFRDCCTCFFLLVLYQHLV